MHCAGPAHDAEELQRRRNTSDEGLADPAQDASGKDASCHGQGCGHWRGILAPITSDIASVRDFESVAPCHLGRHSADLAAAKGCSFVPAELMMSAVPPILISWVATTLTPVHESWPLALPCSSPPHHDYFRGDDDFIVSPARPQLQITCATSLYVSRRTPFSSRPL
jgi:hypothetical protein